MSTKAPTLKQLVKEKAYFCRYEDQTLWYRIIIDKHFFDFPIKLTEGDTGGVFNDSEKGVTLMKWIKKHYEMLESAKAEASDAL